ncbi:MAG: sodium:calcium antiporter [Merdibacter sp.]
MDILMALIMIIAGFFFLVKGADLFVDSASGIAGKLGISPVVIGLTIVAFGTSMPELAVSVTAALEGANEIALGNVVGSNIFNLLVIAGGSACLYPLACDRILLKRDWPLSALAALVLGIFLFGDQRISRGEALILLAMFGAVLFMQLKGAKQTEEKAPETRPMGRLLLFLVIGIAAIVIGGQITVDGAIACAHPHSRDADRPDHRGRRHLAVGLVTSLVAARKGRERDAMGNVIGSNCSISCASSAYRRCSIRSRWRSRRFMTQRFFWP